MNNTRKLELKIFYLFMHADGDFSEPEKRNSDKSTSQWDIIKAMLTILLNLVIHL